MLPFTIDESVPFDYAPGDWVWVPDAKRAVETGASDVPAVIVTADGTVPVTLHLPAMTDDEREILLAGCLMNWYADRNK